MESTRLGGVTGGSGKWQVESRMTPGFWCEFVSRGPCATRKDARLGLSEMMTVGGVFKIDAKLR